MSLIVCFKAYLTEPEKKKKKKKKGFGLSESAFEVG